MLHGVTSLMAPHALENMSYSLAGELACMLECPGGRPAQLNNRTQAWAQLPAFPHCIVLTALVHYSPPVTPACPCCAAVLLGSSVLEAYSLRMAYQMIQQSAEEADMTVWQYIKRGRDPTTVGECSPVQGTGTAPFLTLACWGWVVCRRRHAHAAAWVLR